MQVHFHASVSSRKCVVMKVFKCIILWARDLWLSALLVTALFTLVRLMLLLLFLSLLLSHEFWVWECWVPKLFWTGSNLCHSLPPSADKVSYKYIHTCKNYLCTPTRKEINHIIAILMFFLLIKVVGWIQFCQRFLFMATTHLSNKLCSVSFCLCICPLLRLLLCKSKVRSSP